MFSQVQVKKEQWNLMRLFWRESSNEPLCEYYFTVVPFGLTASTYLAVRALLQCARDVKADYPLAAKTIEEDFYVDDCVTGADSIRSAIQVAKQMDIVLKGAGFELCKWKSNCKKVVKAMSNADIWKIT